MGKNQRKGGRRDRKISNTKAKAKPSSPKVLEEEKLVPHFPDEIIGTILSRLPLNSLARFICVSKQWHSMISDITPKKIGRQMVVAISKLGEASYALRSIDPESVDVRTVRKPWKKMNPSGRLVRLCGSCNGLLLISVDDDLFLWNPLIKYCKKVLSYERLRDRHDHSLLWYHRFLWYERFGDCHEHIVSGLCYDSATNEYKVVLAFGSYARESVAVVGSFRCKSWTSIPFPYNVSIVNSGPVVNGYLHWFATRKNYGNIPSPTQIFYFNPRMGKFEKVPAPQPKHMSGDVVIGLGAWDGCLCMSRMDNPGNNNDNVVEVLAMKEYGMVETWTIMYVVSNIRCCPYRRGPICCPYDLLVPLCCTKNGEALMLIRRKTQYDYRPFTWHMMAYNPIDDSHKDLRIPSSDYNVEAVAYEESVVRPTYDWEEEDVKGKATYVEYFPHKSPQKFKQGRDGHWEPTIEYEQPDLQTEE